MRPQRLTLERLVDDAAVLFSASECNSFVFLGWRAAKVRDGRPRWLDYFVGGLVAGAGLMMLARAIIGFMQEGGVQPWILVVFGSIALSMVLIDWLADAGNLLVERKGVERSKHPLRAESLTGGLKNEGDEKGLADFRLDIGCIFTGGRSGFFMAKTEPLLGRSNPLCRRLQSRELSRHGSSLPLP